MAQVVKFDSLNDTELLQVIAGALVDPVTGELNPIFSGGGGAVDWGDIGGDINDQTDLQTALATRQEVLGYTPENESNKVQDFSVLSTSKYPSVSAVENRIEELISLLDAMVFKGAIACAGEPNYPAADAGDVYKVSSAGRIGGASGPKVEINDTLYCTVDGSLSSDHATVGANWVIVQNNLDGVVIGPANALTNSIAVFDGGTGKLITDAGNAFVDLAGNLGANNIALGFTSQTIGATMTNASTHNQKLTGVGGKIHKLPDTTTVPLSTEYYFINASSGTWVITSYDHSVVVILSPGDTATVRSNSITVNDASAWEVDQPLKANTLIPRVLATASVDLNDSVPIVQTLYVLPTGFNAIITDLILRNFSGTAASFNLQVLWDVSGGFLLNNVTPAALTAGPGQITSQTYLPLASIGDRNINRQFFDSPFMGIGPDFLYASIASPEGSVLTCLIDVIGYLVPQ